MNTLVLFTIICCALMSPFATYLIYEFVVWLLRIRRLRGKEQYVFYEVNEEGEAVRIKE